jgi:hypothetical protein
VIGELCVGGPAVARGYLGRPGLTAQRFVPDPFDVGGRLYRTGDLVRRRADGSLLFLGRADGQVKIRGFRVEIGEIEEVLRGHPAVGEAVVTVLGDDPANRRLAATVMSASGEPAERLREYLADRMPAFLVPYRITVLDALPVGPVGKVDRAAIAAREGRLDAAPSPDPAVADPMAADPIETSLTEIWRDVLGADVRPDSNFFDVGGNSLLLARVRTRVHDELGRDLALVDLFRYPTVAELAARLRSGDDGVAARRAPRGQGHDRLALMRAARSSSRRTN